jgi:hypothetical protein
MQGLGVSNVKQPSPSSTATGKSLRIRDLTSRDVLVLDYHYISIVLLFSTCFSSSSLPATVILPIIESFVPERNNISSFEICRVTVSRSLLNEEFALLYDTEGSPKRDNKSRMQGIYKGECATREHSPPPSLGVIPL